MINTEGQGCPWTHTHTHRVWSIFRLSQTDAQPGCVNGCPHCGTTTIISSQRESFNRLYGHTWTNRHAGDEDCMLHTHARNAQLFRGVAPSTKCSLSPPSPLPPSLSVAGRCHQITSIQGSEWSHQFSTESYLSESPTAQRAKAVWFLTNIQYWITPESRFSKTHIFRKFQKYELFSSKWCLLKRKYRKSSILFC